MLGENAAASKRRISASLASVSLHRTFHDDFDEHPLSNGKMGCRITPAAPPCRKRATGAATAPTSSARPAGTASSRSMSIRAMPDAEQRRSGSIRSRSAMAFSRSSPAARRAESKAGAVQQRIHFRHPHHAELVFAETSAISRSAPRYRSASAYGRRSGCSPTTAAGRRRST